MLFYTTEEVVQLLDEHAIAIDVVCMDGSDDELDFNEVEYLVFLFHLLPH